MEASPLTLNFLEKDGNELIYSLRKEKGRLAEDSERRRQQRKNRGERRKRDVKKPPGGLKEERKAEKERKTFQEKKIGTSLSAESF